MKGRKPIPTNLKIARGANPNSIGLPHNEPEPAKLAKLPDPPRWLGKLAKAHWRHVGPVLFDAGLITAADTESFAAYCQVWGRWQTAERVLIAEGTTETVHGKRYKRLEVSIAKEALAQVLRYQQEFGMTPSSRTRIEVPGVHKDDILAKLKRRREKARNIRPPAEL